MVAHPPTVRAARPSDAPGLVRCLRSAFGPFEPEYTARAYLDTTLTAASARRRLRSMHVLVAVVAPSTIIGTLAWMRAPDGTGHLRGMGVVPAWQGSGVAQRLLDRALEELREAGAVAVTLDTTAPLARAVRFYARNGFRPTGRVRDYFGMPLYELRRELRSP
jgi:ribosomal protein S18 acetylase RimI-like enzyme